MNIAIVYKKTEDYGKTEELYERALEGYEAQLEKNHGDTKRCARNFAICLEASGNVDRLEQLKAVYPLLGVEEVD